jgi:aspartyl-tRNA(Asn)/glutamyl-tRNA(Gln) amidotransferase subunit C
MSLSTEQVKHIAKLARLTLSDSEIEQYSKDLNQILAYVEQLQELDTANVEPMLGAVQNQKALREDEVVNSGLQEKMLANAPDSEGTAIKVPQMS